MFSSPVVTGEVASRDSRDDGGGVEYGTPPPFPPARGRGQHLPRVRGGGISLATSRAYPAPSGSGRRGSFPPLRASRTSRRFPRSPLHVRYGTFPDTCRC